jgi:hypothetical protein
MEVQGEENEISDLLACLQTDSFIRIDHMDMEEYPLKEGETKFQTRYTCE